MSAPKRRHLRLSSIPSPSLMTLLDYPGLVYAALYRGRCMLAIASGGFSAPCPWAAPLSLPGRQGFLLHAVTRLLRPCFISTVYGSVTLCPLSLRGLLGGQGFMTPSAASGVRAGGLPWVRRTASPDAVRLHIKEIPPDIRSRSHTPARPPPQRHIAGSLFVTYPGSASYFLQTRHF